MTPTEFKEKGFFVHTVLAHSYLVFFAGMVLGMVLDIVFGIRINPSVTSITSALLLVLIGSLLIYWAQHTSRKTAPERNDTPSVDDFMKGPYRYLRGPTHLGLLLLISGFGLFINSFFVVAVALLIYLVTHLFFMPAEEKRLSQKYGAVYEAYRANVKL